jgi:hypothetical protein
MTSLPSQTEFAFFFLTLNSRLCAQFTDSESQGFLGRCDSISNAIRDAPGGVWRPMVDTAINGSHKGCDAIGKLRSSIQGELLKIKAYDIKANDIAMDAGEGNSIPFQASTNIQVKKVGYPLIRI